MNEGKLQLKGTESPNLNSQMLHISNTIFHFFYFFFQYIFLQYFFFFSFSRQVKKMKREEMGSDGFAEAFMFSAPPLSSLLCFCKGGGAENIKASARSHCFPFPLSSFFSLGEKMKRRNIVKKYIGRSKRK